MGDAVTCMGFVEMKRVENLYRVGWAIYAKDVACVQWEWTHIQNSICLIKTFTGHKPFPMLKSSPTLPHVSFSNPSLSTPLDLIVPELVMGWHSSWSHQIQQEHGEV